MIQPDEDFSTQKITPQLLAQIVDALKNKDYGSIEIYIQNYTVTQITERTITKVAKPSGKKLIPNKNGHQKLKYSQDNIDNISGV